MHQPKQINVKFNQFNGYVDIEILIWKLKKCWL